MTEEQIAEAVARAMAEREGLDWPSLSEDPYAPNSKPLFRQRADAALAAHKAAVAEAERQKPAETYAEEVARLNREIGERRLRLQYLVCGDPRVRVEVPSAAAPDQR